MQEDYKDMLIIEGTEEGHINRLIQIAEESQKVSPKKALELGIDALELSRKLDYQMGIGMALFRVGKSYWMLGEMENSSRHLLEALEQARRLNAVRLEAETLNCMGNVCAELENYDRGLEHYMAAMKISAREGFKDFEVVINNNLGSIYMELKEMNPALDYFFKALTLAEENQRLAELTTPLYNIGEVYYRQGEYAVALEYLEKARDMCLEYQDNYILTSALQMIGKCHKKLGDLEKALAFMVGALEIARDGGMVGLEVGSLLDLVRVHRELEDVERAEGCLSRAMQISETSRNWLLIARVSLQYVKYYERQNNYEQALFYYKKYYEAEKIIESDKAEQRLRNIAAQFRMEQAYNEKELFRIKNIELKGKSDELERKSDELELLNTRITAISRIGQDITASLDLYQIFDKVYKHINDLVDAYSLGIALFDEAAEEIRFSVYFENGRSLNNMPVIPLNSDVSLAAWCVRNNKTVMLGDYAKDHPRYIAQPGPLVSNHVDMSSVVYHPLVVGNCVIGVITVQSPVAYAYSEQDMATLTMLASYIAIAVNNASKSSKLEKEIQMRKEAQQELEALSQRLLNLSQLDGLTGVSNRRRFDEYFEAEWKRAYRERTSVSMMFIDVDYFKQYNDNYGHISGDSCLIRVANALRGALKRSSDLISRYGGDEFVVLMCNTDTEGAMLVAQRMQEAIQALKLPHQYSEASDVVSISIGIATIAPRSTDDPTLFTQTADKALYNAKQNGRNCIELIEMPTS